jgi:hypothetical protein
MARRSLLHLPHRPAAHGSERHHHRDRGRAGGWAPYSFLRLETEKGLLWVAVPMAEVPKKSRLTVKNGAALKNFESKQAGRKFEAVVFGVMEKG